MFKVTDLTGPIPSETISNDIKDICDIVIGITGSEFSGILAREIAGFMRFGDVYDTDNRYRIECFNEQLERSGL